MNNKRVSLKTLTLTCMVVFVFLLGFSFSVQAYAIRQKELNSPVSQYLRENYGVDSVEEYEAKIEQEIWLNYSRQVEALASEHPELNLTQWQFPQSYLQAGTSTYQPPTIKSEQPFYAVVFGEPVVSLQIFTLSGLGLLGLAAVPPIKKRKQLRQALILGIVVLCVFSVGYFVGLTVAQTGTITIEPNSFQTEASYIIFTDGTTVYARNGKTGAIDFSGTDASTVIQSAVNAAPTGASIFFKTATYNLNSPITINKRLRLVGEVSASSMFCGYMVDDYILVVTGSAHYTVIENLGFWGASNRNCHGIKIDATRVTAQNCYFDALKTAILVIGDTQGISFNSIKNCRIKAELPIKVSVGNYWATETLIEFCNTYTYTDDFAIIAGVETTGTGSNSFVRVVDCCIEGSNGVGKGIQFGSKAFWSYVTRTRFEQLSVGIEGVSAQYITVKDNTFSSVANIKNGTFSNCVWKNNIGFVTENSGTATFSGNGSQTTFTIAHGLAGTPRSWRVEAGSADAKGDKYVTADATNLTVTFATAPPAGTNNVVLVWSAEM